MSLEFGKAFFHKLSSRGSSVAGTSALDQCRMQSIIRTQFLMLWPHFCSNIG